MELNVDLSLCGSGGGSGTAQQQRTNSSHSSSSRRKERDSESQITSLLQRLILPHAVNYTRLAIVPGRYVWRLSIDIVVLRCDGCILDACSLALRMGLYNTKLPCVKSAVMVGEEEGARMDDGEGFFGAGAVGGSGSSSNNKNDLIVDGDIRNAMPPPGVENCPLVVTVSVLSAAVPPTSSPPPPPPPPTTTTTSSISGNATTFAAASSSPAAALQQRQQTKRRHYISIIDARTEEELCASSHVCVSIDPCGLVCGVHTLGGCGIGGGQDSLASDGANEERENKGDDNDHIHYDDDDEIMRSSSSSSMPLTMLGDVVASATMASKNLYSLLNMNDAVVVRKSGDDDGNGYSYLLKNHFLIQ